MKEITRIHIAKQAYDIETTAKKDFEKYMKKLEFTRVTRRFWLILRYESRSCLRKLVWKRAV